MINLPDNYEQIIGEELQRLAAANAASIAKILAAAAVAGGHEPKDAVTKRAAPTTKSAGNPHQGP